MELVIKSPKKIIWDVEGLFQAMEYMMPGNTIDKRRKYFIHNYISKGDKIWSMIEFLANKIYDLDDSGKPNLHYDSKSKNIKFGQKFETRCMTDGTSFAAAKDNGGQRSAGPKSLKNAQDIENNTLKRLSEIDYLIVADIFYPPYIYMFVIPTQGIMRLFEGGKFRISRGENKGKFNTKPSRRTIYNVFFNTNTPLQFKKWEESNPAKLTTEQ